MISVARQASARANTAAVQRAYRTIQYPLSAHSRQRAFLFILIPSSSSVLMTFSLVNSSLSFSSRALVMVYTRRRVHGDGDILQRVGALLGLFDVGGEAVRGVLHHGQLDRSGLSPG